MSENHIDSIMLLGTENPVALPVVRALGVAMPGTPLHALSRYNEHVHLPKYSRYIHSHDYLESTDEEGFFQEINSKIAAGMNTLLMPVDEYFVRLLSSLKYKFADYIYLPPLPEVKIFDSLVNKGRLGELLSEFQFPCAKTYSLAGLNISGIDDDFFPCLIKPVRGSSGQGIQKIENKDMLHSTIANIDCENHILQEIVPGFNIDCSLLAVNGDIKAFTIQKGLESIGFMFSTAIRFEHNQSVFKSVQRLMEQTCYSGLAHLDFRLDERDNLPKLIDFNARFWHSLLGSRAAGVDFTELSCFAAMDIQFDKPSFKESTYLMGKSTFQHYRNRMIRFFIPPRKESLFTDLWDRIRDPLPEFVRLLNNIAPHNPPVNLKVRTMARRFPG